MTSWKWTKTRKKFDGIENVEHKSHIVKPPTIAISSCACGVFSVGDFWSSVLREASRGKKLFSIDKWAGENLNKIDWIHLNIQAVWHVQMHILTTNKFISINVFFFLLLSERITEFELFFFFFFIFF